ncbi:MAG: bifunctional nuclease family protein [Microbacterium sp.]|nr:bifunctional nuclease family protein [Microbacterium sp.]
MVLVRVSGVALDPSRQYVILLKPADQAPGEGSILPIWIGEQEATAILVAVEGAAVPRPLAHDLMRALLDAAESQVVQVEVTRLDGGTFYAEITLATPLGERVVDARPSDAIALASRVGAPIFVADAVLDEAGVPDPSDAVEDDAADSALDDGASDEGAVDGGVVDADAADKLAEFQRFLDDVDPDDFRS